MSEWDDEKVDGIDVVYASDYNTVVSHVKAIENTVDGGNSLEI